MDDRQYARLAGMMARHDRGMARRIQHFLKVHALSRIIGIREGLDEETMYILETAALIHDIGIRAAEEKYSSTAGPYQEREGAAEAGPFLAEAGGYTAEQIERIVYLVGHHHTYEGVDGMDRQILLEADMLVNLYENSAKYQAVLAAKKDFFKTEAGRELMEEMYEGDGRQAAPSQPAHQGLVEHHPQGDRDDAG